MTCSLSRITSGGRFKAILFAMCLGCTAAFAWGANAPLKLTVLPHDENRRFVVAEYTVPADRLTPPFNLRGEKGQPVFFHMEPTKGGNIVRWIIRELAANEALTFTLADGIPLPRFTSLPVDTSHLLTLIENPAGFISIRNVDHEITRFHTGSDLGKFKRPYFYPVMVQGVSITRSFPMETKANEERDHPHHTGVWFTHGEVNGKDYWAKLNIDHKRFVKKEAGRAYVQLTSESNWGTDLSEVTDIRIYDAGQDSLMDWTITLTAENGPVHLGKTKEGGMSVRVATGITAPEPNRQDQAGRGVGKMIDSDGNKGEPAIRDDKGTRKQAAAWADDYGVVDGKTVGVAIMNHPTSWRYPTNWHVRNYGLFAANAFFIQGEHNMKKGESITLKYRLYFHGGDPIEAKVAEVYAGYAKVKVVVESK